MPVIPHGPITSFGFVAPLRKTHVLHEATSAVTAGKASLLIRRGRPHVRPRRDKSILLDLVLRTQAEAGRQDAPSEIVSSCVADHRWPGFMYLSHRGAGDGARFLRLCAVPAVR